MPLDEKMYERRWAERPRAGLAAYVYAVVAAAAATAARVLLGTFFGYQHQYAMFYIALLLTCWFGGLGPALLTTGLGVLVAAFLRVQAGGVILGFQPSNLSGLEFYLIVALTASILFDAERRARRQAAESARMARVRLDQLQQEIARREIAEEEASEAEEKFRLTVEHAPVGIARLNPDGRFEDVNPQFCAITGYSRQELLASGFAAITHPDDLAQTVAGWDRLRAGTRRSFTLEQRYIRKDGTLIWGILTAAAVKAADGAPRFMLAVIEDITRRKQAEAQLREAQKMESIGLLAGGIAHDFNNLMTSVLGNASLASEELPPDSGARRMIEAIAAAAERAAELTRQLLAYAGKGGFFRAPLDVSEVAARGAELVRAAAPAIIEFRLDLASNLPPVMADMSQIQQIVTNLALNAVEAIGDRPGTVTVRTAVKHLEEGAAAAWGRIHDGDYVAVIVEDTGCGMDHATRRRIFEPFFTTKFMGRGLGLAAVGGIVRSLGGAVVVRSEVGRGTAVEVLIPLE